MAWFTEPSWTTRHRNEGGHRQSAPVNCRIPGNVLKLLCKSNWHPSALSHEASAAANAALPPQSYTVLSDTQPALHTPQPEGGCHRLRQNAEQPAMICMGCTATGTQKGLLSRCAQHQSSQQQQEGKGPVWQTGRAKTLCAAACAHMRQGRKELHSTRQENLRVATWRTGPMLKETGHDTWALHAGHCPQLATKPLHAAKWRCCAGAAS